MGNDCPLSLLNCDFKILAKILMTGSGVDYSYGLSC